MRALFFLLLLANAVFYVYAFVARERNATELAVPELQINADKIRILRRGESGAASVAPAAAASAGPAACLEWGVMAGPDIARADAALARLDLGAYVFRRVMETRPGAVKQVRFFMREPSQEMVGRLAEVQREFPGSTIEVGPCPAALQGGGEREEAPPSARSTHAFDQRAGGAPVFERD
jgi:hypothetical protein